MTKKKLTIDEVLSKLQTGSDMSQITNMGKVTGGLVASDPVYNDYHPRLAATASV